MRTRYKYSLATSALIVAMLSGYASTHLSRQRSFAQRFRDIFSRVVELLSEDPNYIVKANYHVHLGFSTVADPNRLSGLAPDNPILDRFTLSPLHATVAVAFETKATLLKRVISICILPTGEWLKPGRLREKEKTIMVAASNLTTKKMKTLAGKVAAMKTDSDISIAFTYLESRR